MGRLRLLLFVLFVILLIQISHAADRNYLIPNPSYTRDLSMGASTIATFYAPQSQSVNPAGFSFLDTRKSARKFSVLLDPGGAWHIRSYFRNDKIDASKRQQAIDAARLLVHGGVFQWRIMTAALLLSEPVMEANDTIRYNSTTDYAPLSLHQNSMLVVLNLHPRVAVGGEISRYYRGDHFVNEGYSYGVILRPHRINVGVQYQKFPQGRSMVWHPLDRRSDESTSAAVAYLEEDFTFSLQVMNLTQSGKPAFLEPHAGIEWRPVRAIALRCGGVEFSRSPRWAWTAGIGFLDANWLREKAARLKVPDDILQIGCAVIYNRSEPELVIGSLSLAWRL